MMTINQGNLLKVIHETGCDYQTAKEALNNSNSWIETYRYAKKIN